MDATVRKYVNYCRNDKQEVCVCVCVCVCVGGGGGVDFAFYNQTKHKKQKAIMR